MRGVAGGAYEGVCTPASPPARYEGGTAREYPSDAKREYLYNPDCLVDAETRAEALDEWARLMAESVRRIERKARAFERAKGPEALVEASRELADATIYAASLRGVFLSTIRQAFGRMEDLHDAEIGRPRV